MSADRSGIMKRREMLRLSAMVTALSGASAVSGASTARAASPNAPSTVPNTIDPASTDLASTLGLKAWKIDPAVSLLSPQEQTAYFHKLFDAIAANKGANVVEGGAQHFRVARQNTRATGLLNMEVLFVIPANTTFNVQDGFTIELDSNSVPSKTGLLLFQTGAMTDEGTAGLRGANIVTNNEAIGGGSIWAWGNRRPESFPAATQNLLVDGVSFRDSRVAITNARQSPAAPLLNQDKNWRLTNGYVEKCNNRAVELSQLDGALLANWVMRDVETAIHLLGYSRNIRVRNIDAVSRGSGLWINYGCQDIDIDGVNLRIASGYDPSSGTIEFHSEPAPAAYTVRNVRVRNARLGVSPTGTYRRSLTFMLAPGATKVLWEDIKFKSCEFDGDVVVAPATQRQAGESRNIRFEDCDFHGDILNLPTAEYNAHDFVFSNCNFRALTNLRINANNFHFINCTFARTPIVNPSACNTYIKNCATPSVIIDNGKDSLLVGNDVLSAANIDPTSINGMTVWDANILKPGPLNVWYPVIGAKENVAFKSVGSAPQVVDSAFNGHKALRFDATLSQRIVTEAFPSAKKQPYTIIQAYRITENSNVMNLVAGLTNGQPIVKRLATGEMAYRSSAATTPIVSPAPYPAADRPHVAVIEFNGEKSKVYLDSDTSTTTSGNLVDADPLTGLRFGSSGTGNPPFYNGDVQLIAFYPGLLSESQRFGVSQFLSAKIQGTSG